MVPCLPLWDIETRGKILSSVFLEGRVVATVLCYNKKDCFFIGESGQVYRTVFCEVIKGIRNIRVFSSHSQQ